MTNQIQSDRIVKLSQDRKLTENNVEKLFKKTFKKVLTKGEVSDIITKLSARAGSDWTLKIEQRKTRDIEIYRTKNLTRTIPKREYTSFEYE